MIVTLMSYHSKTSTGWPENRSSGLDRVYCDSPPNAYFTRHELKALVNEGRWALLSSLFGFQAQYLGDMKTIDWRCVPPRLYKVLQGKSKCTVEKPAGFCLTTAVKKQPDFPIELVRKQYHQQVARLEAQSAQVAPVPVVTRKEADYKFSVMFDGGYFYDTKQAYGSWEVQFNGFSKHVNRQHYLQADYDVKLSNNVAEYLALLSALQWLDAVKEKSLYQLSIHGDSQLVIKQLSGDYKCKCPAMKSLHADCWGFLYDWKEWSVHWHQRKHSVKRFGH